jgi:thiol-disulfide isomerase/thioredoxin
MRALVLSFLLLCVCFSSAKAGERDKYYHLGADVISEAIYEETGKRRAVVIYASWCPYCKKAMPFLVNIEKIKRGTILPVSVDKDPRMLIRFINQLRSYPFPVVIVDETVSGSLERELGASRRDGVPYYILLDENNKVTKAGTFSPDYIAQYLLKGTI